MHHASLLILRFLLKMTSISKIFIRQTFPLMNNRKIIRKPLAFKRDNFKSFKLLSGKNKNTFNVIREKGNRLEITVNTFLLNYQNTSKL